MIRLAVSCVIPYYGGIGDETVVTLQCSAQENWRQQYSFV